MRKNTATALTASAIALTAATLLFTAAPRFAALDESAVEALTLTELDTAPASRQGALELDVPTDALSVLLTLTLEHPDDGIGIARVVDPAGRVLHATAFEPDSWEARHQVSAISGDVLVGNGDLSLFLPTTPRVPLEPGRYRIELEVDPPDAVLRGAAFVTRFDSASGPPDGRAHAIDLHLSVFHTARRYRSRAFAREVERTWRPALDATLAPHALRIGTITVENAGRGDARRFVEIDDEAESNAVCSRARQTFADDDGTRSPDSPGSTSRDAPHDPSTTLPLLALHVALVGEIIGGQTDAWTSGLSAQPGAAFDPASPNGCIVIAERPWSEDEDGEPVPLSVESITTTLLHELGHFVGLAHTSEADGRVFDVLDDTPRCEAARYDGRETSRVDVPAEAEGNDEVERDTADGVVDERECADGGGADNVMFWTSEVDVGPWTLTPEQAWVLRRHPLFRPVRAFVDANDASDGER